MSAKRTLISLEVYVKENGRPEVSQSTQANNDNELTAALAAANFAVFQTAMVVKGVPPAQRASYIDEYMKLVADDMKESFAMYSRVNEYDLSEIKSKNKQN